MVTNGECEWTENTDAKVCRWYSDYSARWNKFKKSIRKLRWYL